MHCKQPLRTPVVQVRNENNPYTPLWISTHCKHSCLFHIFPWLANLHIFTHSTHSQLLYLLYLFFVWKYLPPNRLCLTANFPPLNLRLVHSSVSQLHFSLSLCYLFSFDLCQANSMYDFRLDFTVFSAPLDNPVLLVLISGLFGYCFAWKNLYFGENFLCPHLVPSSSQDMFLWL